MALEDEATTLDDASWWGSESPGVERALREAELAKEAQKAAEAERDKLCKELTAMRSVDQLKLKPYDNPPSPLEETLRSATKNLKALLNGSLQPVLHEPEEELEAKSLASVASTPRLNSLGPRRQLDLASVSSEKRQVQQPGRPAGERACDLIRRLKLEEEELSKRLSKNRRLWQDDEARAQAAQHEASVALEQVKDVSKSIKELRAEMSGAATEMKTEVEQVRQSLRPVPRPAGEAPALAALAAFASPGVLKPAEIFKPDAELVRRTDAPEVVDTNTELEKVREQLAESEQHRRVARSEADMALRSLEACQSRLASAKEEARSWQLKAEELLQEDDAFRQQTFAGKQPEEEQLRRRRSPGDEGDFAEDPSKLRRWEPFGMRRLILPVVKRQRLSSMLFFAYVTLLHTWAIWAWTRQ